MAPHLRALLLLAAWAPRPSRAAGRGGGDASALVQVELLVADVARRSRARAGAEPRLGAPVDAAESELATAVPAVQLHSMGARRTAVRAAEAQGTAFDFDLGFDFSQAAVPPTDPAKVERILNTMHSYTATAEDFSKTASTVTMDLNASTAREFIQVKDALLEAFVTLCSKAGSFEQGFVRSISSSLEGMPGPMQDMAGRQTEQAKTKMRDFISPILRLQKEISNAQNASSICLAANGDFVDLRKRAKVLIILNRQQAVGSKAMLREMPESWKPWVNVSLVTEMGDMAAETADCVENAVHYLINDMAVFMRERLDCSSSGAATIGQHLGLILTGVLAVCLSWL